MCKVLIIPGIRGKRRKRVCAFIKAAMPHLTASDNDGFGYAAIAGNNLFGERWLNVKDAFKRRQPHAPEVQSMLTHFGSALDPDCVYNYFGKPVFNLKGVSTICLHARMSTNTVTLENTHPFVAGDSALIHNGVVDASALSTPTSTCDSEGILSEYTDAKVCDDPKEIQKVADSLDGYYACGVLAKDANGKFVLDIFKDNIASLYCVYIPALGTHVFCTTIGIVQAAAKTCGFKLGGVAAFKDNTFLRIDAITGKQIGQAFQFEKLDTYSLREPIGIAENTELSDADAEYVAECEHDQGIPYTASGSWHERDPDDRAVDLYERMYRRKKRGW